MSSHSLKNKVQGRHLHIQISVQESYSLTFSSMLPIPYNYYHCNLSVSPLSSHVHLCFIDHNILTERDHNSLIIFISPVPSKQSHAHFPSHSYFKMTFHSYPSLTLLLLAVIAPSSPQLSFLHKGSPLSNQVLLFHSLTASPLWPTKQKGLFNLKKNKPHTSFHQLPS